MIAPSGCRVCQGVCQIISESSNCQGKKCLTFHRLYPTRKSYSHTVCLALSGSKLFVTENQEKTVGAVCLKDTNPSLWEGGCYSLPFPHGGREQELPKLCLMCFWTNLFCQPPKCPILDWIISKNLWPGDRFLQTVQLSVSWILGRAISWSRAALLAYV